MGTASQKFLTNSSGVLAEVVSVSTSAGAADSGKVVATGANGFIDPTLVNSKTTSAGAGDSGKVAALNTSGILDSTIVNSKTTSAGAADSGKVVALNASGLVDDTVMNATVTSAANKILKLDATGRIDSTVLPVGLGAEVISIVASEALSAGNVVNIWNNAGVANVRKADGSIAGKEVSGFVLAACVASASASVYMPSQTNTQQTGMTPGAMQYLSNTVPGGVLAVAPTTSGHVVQQLGRSSSATTFVLTPGPAITLA